jgi:tellurite resistance protein
LRYVFSKLITFIRIKGFSFADNIKAQKCLNLASNKHTMKLSSGAKNLRQIIEKAMEDHRITKAEYDMIIHIATEDGNIDRQEQALLKELQDMIQDKTIRLVP